MVGGLGHCGQELCCKRLGGEFCPVSIRMAKEQDLSLNPQKISGVCGRLMCCLRYEFDAYKDFKSRAPKQNATVETPDGPAKVVDLDVPREIVSLKIMGEKPVKVPLADFDPPEEGSNRPNRVGEEAWQDATTADPIGFAGESALFGGQSGNGGSKKQQGQRQGGEGAKKQGPKGMQPAKPRPGQKSSGLRQGQKPQQPRQDKAPRPERSGAPSGEGGRPTGDGGHRRARRRSHKAGGSERAARRRAANSGRTEEAHRE